MALTARHLTAWATMAMAVACMALCVGAPTTGAAPPSSPLIDPTARIATLTGRSAEQVEFCLSEVVVCTVAAAAAAWATADTYRAYGTSGHTGGPDDRYRHDRWAYRTRLVLDAMLAARGDELQRFFRHHEQGADPWCAYGDPPAACHELTRDDLRVDQLAMQRAQRDTRALRLMAASLLPTWG